MLFTILFLALLIPYLVVGAKISRNRYAVENARYRAALPGYNMTLEKYNKLVAERKALSHASYCYLLFPILSDRGCTCSKRNRWNVLNAEIKSANPGGMEKPTNPFVTLGSWPVYLLNNYLRNGNVNTYVPELTEMLEREVFKELS